MNRKVISREKFSSMLAWQVQKKAGSSFKVMPSQTLKTNGVKTHSLVFRIEGSSISPNICLDGFYFCYVNGILNMSDIEEKIFSIYNQNQSARMDTESVLHWESARKNIRCRLVSTERNGGLLSEIPHRKILDLSFAYYLNIFLEDGTAGAVHVRNEYLKLWGVCEKDLYSEAWKNMQDEAGHENSMNITGQIFGMSDLSILSDIPMYLISNRTRFYGAVHMFNSIKMKEMSDMLGSDLYILPASLHEIIITPVQENCTAEEMAEIVREVNEEELDADEILSYHVYRYCRNTGTVSIEA